MYVTPDTTSSHSMEGRCTTFWVAQRRSLGWKGPERMLRDGGRKGGPQAGTPEAKARVLRGLECLRAGQAGSPPALNATKKLRLDRSFIKDKQSLKRRCFLGTMGNGLEEERLRIWVQGTCSRTEIQVLLDVESTGLGGHLDDAGATMKE